MNEEEISIDEYRKNITSYYNSKGVKKMWNYFLELIKKDSFNKDIKKIRKKFDIPPQGFEVRNGDYYLPPKEFWEEGELTSEGKIIKKGDVDEFSAVKKFRAARKEIIKKICDKYKLPAYGYTDLLEPYVYYNVPFSFQSYERNFGLLEVDELKNYIRKSAQGNKEELYPIMIKISPYASKNDLIDFVKNKFVWENEIEPLRDKYKDKNIKIGKFKTKNEKIKERNDFVYENRHLPRIKIMKLVNDKFEGCVGYEYVNKIIALEDRKRKDVNS